MLRPGIPDIRYGNRRLRSHNEADLGKLPVVTFILGIGDRSQPSYNIDTSARASISTGSTRLTVR
jgi:hypothetical protein